MLIILFALIYPIIASFLISKGVNEWITLSPMFVGVAYLTFNFSKTEYNKIRSEKNWGSPMCALVAVISTITQVIVAFIVTMAIAIGLNMIWTQIKKLFN
jgi:hypothetical protein